MIAPAPPTSSPRGAQLVAVGARGLEAVVAVGEHDRSAPPIRARMSAMRPGSSIAPSSWTTPSASTQVASIGVGLELLGEAGREAEAPDRVDVRPRRAEQREPIGLRLRGGALVGEHARVARLGERQRADHAAGVARLAVRVAELHAVRVEAGRGVDREHARLLPGRERVGRPLVAVAVVVLVAGEEQPHRVVRRRPPRAPRAVPRRSRRRVERRAPRGRCRPRRSRNADRQRRRSRARGAPGSGMPTGCSTAPADSDRPIGDEERRAWTTSGDAYVAFQEGSRLLADGNVHAAVVALERARRLEPEKGSVRETLARAYYRSGRFEHAEREFRAALDLEPVNDYAHYGLGLCRLRAGRSRRRPCAPAARDRDAARQRRLPARARRGQPSDAGRRRDRAAVSCAAISTAWSGAATRRSRARPTAIDAAARRRAGGSCSRRTTRACGSPTTWSGSRASACPPIPTTCARARRPRPRWSRPELAPGAAVLACAGPGVVEALEAARARVVVAAGPVDAVVVGFHRDFDFDGLTRAADAARGGALFVATNLDPTYPIDGGVVPGAGALAAAVATAAGRAPEVAGKPERPMAELVRSRFGERGRGGGRPAVDRRRVRRRARLAVRARAVGRRGQRRRRAGARPAAAVRRGRPRAVLVADCVLLTAPVIRESALGGP